MDSEPLSDAELAAIAQRCANATPGPWVSSVEGRDHHGGSNIIIVGAVEDNLEDIEPIGATVADQDFIAAARQDVPRLLAEITRLKSSGGV